MHGVEEWVLVYLGSQHKRIEQPVRPVFPDYLSVPYDYDGTVTKENRKVRKGRFKRKPKNNGFTLYLKRGKRKVHIINL